MALALAGTALAQADAWSYSEANVNTTWSDVGPDLQLTVINSTFNDFYNANVPPSFGNYTNTPVDTFEVNNIGASIQSSATGYAYTGWLNENQTVYAIFNNGNTAESITVSTHAHAEGNDGSSGSGGSGKLSSSAYLVEDFGDGIFVDSASVGNVTGFAQDDDSGQVTIMVNPNQTLDFIARDIDITLVNSNRVFTPEPVTTSLGIAGIGLFIRRRRQSAK